LGSSLALRKRVGSSLPIFPKDRNTIKRYFPLLVLMLITLFCLDFTRKIEKNFELERHQRPKDNKNQAIVDEDVYTCDKPVYLTQCCRAR